MSDGTSRFCGACGASATPVDTFCTRCGAPLAAPAVAPPPAQAPAPSGERTLAIVGNVTQMAGFMGMKQKTYSIVITDRRLIFAELTKERITALVDGARESAKAQGKGFFGQWGAQLGTSFNYQEAYRDMAPEAILAETPGNFAIERPAFKGAKFKTGTVYDDGRNSPDELVIKHDGGKMTFRVDGNLGAVKDRFCEAGLV